MKTIRQYNIVIMFALALFSACPVLAQDKSTELIKLTLAPGQQVDLFFPNTFDLLHEKRLTLEGTWVGGVPGAAGSITLAFDYLDLTGAMVLLPLGTFGVLDSPTTITATTLIPFCPPQVSLHLLADIPTRVDFAFTHECFTQHVPDGGTTAAALTMALTGMGWAARRVRRTQSV
jgi:hypothetical protein